jgi:tripartite-type tricarboxylate transporter receptor subunit TctC
MITLTLRRLNCATRCFGLAMLLTAAIVFSGGQPAYTQPLQGRAITLVVPYGPGGVGSNLARHIAQYAEKNKGQKIIVENRPGAASTIGTDQVARSAPDGTTIVLQSNGMITTSLTRASVPYDYRALTPLCMIVESLQVIAVNSNSPFKTLKEFVEGARAKPGEITFGAAGQSQQIAGEMLKHIAKVDMTFVPFPGGAQAVTAVLGGHITSTITNYNDMQGQLDAGTLRALAVASPSRGASLPDVPTFTEAGYPVEAPIFFGFQAPAKTPTPVVAYLNDILSSAVQSPELSPQLKQMGLDVSVKCGEEYSAHLEKLRKIYSDVVKYADIKG